VPNQALRGSLSRCPAGSFQGGPSQQVQHVGHPALEVRCRIRVARQVADQHLVEHPVDSAYASLDGMAGGRPASSAYRLAMRQIIRSRLWSISAARRLTSARRAIRFRTR
jgi:hypothetical protein